MSLTFFRTCPSIGCMLVLSKRKERWSRKKKRKNEKEKKKKKKKGRKRKKRKKRKKTKKKKKGKRKKGRQLQEKGKYHKILPVVSKEKAMSTPALGSASKKLAIKSIFCQSIFLMLS
jgi:hypothetical protein